MRSRKSEDGFTLVELMVVVAIIGVISVVAVVAIRPNDHARSVKGFSDIVAGRFDLARQRAIATQRIQRLEIAADGIHHFQAPNVGLVPPSDPNDFEFIHSDEPRSGVEIYATDNTAHLSENTAVPSEGDGLGATVDFLPDGSAQSFTVFLSNDDQTTTARVILFRATATPTAYDSF